jgi:RNA-directed DNA polymerase
MAQVPEEKTMRTFKNLFDEIVAFKNLLHAAKKAQVGKRFKPSTARFNLNLEQELLALQGELLEQRYQPGPYRDFLIFDPKRRVISAAPYRDRVVHHALCNIIEPLFDKTFIFDSYACRKGKGTHKAMDRYTQFARKNKYVLKCDIQKYFQSIDRDILIKIISQKIRCERTLWLIQKIVESKEGTDLLPQYLPEDGLSNPRGIPIGNLTSQFFANIYLNGFDHFLKKHLECKYYIRYVDDFVILHDSKTRLHQVREEIVDYLKTLRLCLHENKYRIYRVVDGIDFLGFRIFPTHRLLRKQNVKRASKRLKRLKEGYLSGKISLKQIGQSIHSWIGHVSRGDTYRLRKRLLGEVFFQRG